MSDTTDLRKVAEIHLVHADTNETTVIVPVPAERPNRVDVPVPDEWTERQLCHIVTVDERGAVIDRLTGLAFTAGDTVYVTTTSPPDVTS